MSYVFRKQMLDLADLLKKASKVLKTSLELRKINEEGILPLLDDCQETTAKMCNEIELICGESTEAVEKLKEHSKTLIQMRSALKEPEERQRLLKDIIGQAKQIRKLIDEQISGKKEIVFLPYKASMWDSMESVWKAAAEDDECEVYVVPIPYFEKNMDGTFSKYHYEGNDFPENVTITYYETYDVDKHWPDAIYVHNPYDEFNHVTSVDPRFYAERLRKRTEQLIYIPHYASTGGIGKGMEACPVYYWSNSIITQAENSWQYFDPEIPQERFQPLGAPQFDHVITVCGDYEKYRDAASKEGDGAGEEEECAVSFRLPEEWKARLEGKKVYLYSSSIDSMLADTEAFLKKMGYIFRCFKGRADSCLIWRPEAFMELTLDAMRPSDRQAYDEWKETFINEQIGIYDDTSDAAVAVAVCDAFIGDRSAPEAALCGVAGKPLFILNYNLSSEPEEEDWRGQMISGFHASGNDEWMVTQGNKLYHAPACDYKYEFSCDLSEYASGDYYRQVIRVNGKDYVCPTNAQDIVEIKDGKIEKRIELEPCVSREREFWGAVGCGKYLFLIPDQYPAIVRYDTENDKIWYFQDHLDILFGAAEGLKRIGGYCVHGGCLYIASPVDNQLWIINPETGEEQIVTTEANSYGCFALESDGEELWFLPYSGNVVSRWNPVSKEIHEYGNYPDGLTCKHGVFGYDCMERPFGSAAFAGNYVYLSPSWASAFMRLDKETGEINRWCPPFEMPETVKNEYFRTEEKGYFLPRPGLCNEDEYCLYSALDRKLYKVNLANGEYSEIAIEFNADELKRQEPGFHKNSEWLQYACEENVFNTLPAYLEGNVIGDAFDREKQIEAFQEIAVNSDGTCGEKVHKFVCKKIEEQ